MTTPQKPVPGRSLPRHFPALRFFLVFIFLLAALLPLAAVDDSWLSFESGKNSFDERRFGEALNAWNLAVETRRSLFDQARARILSARADPEAVWAKDSISALIAIFAKRDVIERDYAAIREKAGGSLRKEAELLKERRLADGFSGFLDALVLILEHRPASEIGDSLDRLLEAAAALRSYPEAEYWIGRVYLVEGELRLAELQFKRAYDMRESLEIPEDRFVILEALAGIYRDQARWRDYEETLGEIVDAAPLFAENEDFLRGAMERSLAEEGFDKFMILYRVDLGASLAATVELGEHYLRNGRPQALIHLAAGANGMLTRIIGHLKEEDPSFVYRNLPTMLERIEADRELSRYAEEVGLFRALYYLGEALVAQGYRDSARGIWRALARKSAQAPWSALSEKALGRAPGASPNLP